MSVEEYAKAKKLGRRAFRSAADRGENPYIKALDEALKENGTGGEIRLGICEIPLSLIIGTKTKNRAGSFACNFMPILSERSEFALKWQALYESQLSEGIREAIKVYEYKNRFYVEEGNKRVSVLKYVGAAGILGDVTRIMPKRSDSKENRVYREYAEFNRVTRMFDLIFTEPGAYKKLCSFFGENLEVQWSEQSLQNLRAAFLRFSDCYDRERKLSPEARSEAFLVYLDIFGLSELLSGNLAEIREHIEKARREFLSTEEPKVALIENPPAAEQSARKEKVSLFELLFAKGTEEPFKVAFLNDKSPETSRWTYGHALGFGALSDKYGDEVELSVYNHCDTEAETEAALREAIAKGNKIIFATAGQMQPPLLAAAIEHPEIRFLNCTVNTAYKSIRTYYPRLYEAKFVLGTIAASLSQSDDIGYVADYPVYGAVANINAFAIGAQMINPRARVHLKWSNVREERWLSDFETDSIGIISGPDLKIPSKADSLFGLLQYRKEQGDYKSLAMPVIDWGRYYELLVASVLSGSFFARELTETNQAVNYFYGMSAGVVDVFCSSSIPYQTRKLVQIFKNEIAHGDVFPFFGELHSRKGSIKTDGSMLDYHQIVDMNWLNENIVGSIPEIDEFKEEAQGFVEAFGVKE